MNQILMKKTETSFTFLLIISLFHFIHAQYSEVHSDTAGVAEIHITFHPTHPSVIFKSDTSVGHTQIYSISAEGTVAQTNIYGQVSGSISHGIGIQGSDWFIFSASTKIQFCTTSTSQEFKNYGIVDNVIDMSDKMDNSYFYTIDDNNDLNIYDLTLINGNTAKALIISMGSNPTRVLGLQDLQHIAASQGSTIFIYSLSLPTYSPSTSFLITNPVRDISRSQSSTYIAAVDDTSLFFINWKDGISYDWQQLLSEPPLLVKIHPNSLDYFIVAYHGALDTGGLIGYDRAVNLETYGVNTAQSTSISLDISSDAKFIVVGGSSGQWKVFQQTTCSSTCMACSSPSSSSCSSCQSGKVLDSATDGSCIVCDLLTNFMSSDTTPYTCTSCNIACDGCTGATFNDCSSCASGYELSGQLCKKQCNSNQYWTINNQCSSCPSECSNNCQEITGECQSTTAVILFFTFLDF